MTYFAGTGNRVVDCLVFCEEWGRMLSSSSSEEDEIEELEDRGGGESALRTMPARRRLLCRCRWQQIVAWSAVVVVVALMVSFYAALLGKSSWASFLIFLLVDCGVGFVSLAIILVRPLQTVLSLLHRRRRGRGIPEQQEPISAEEAAAATAPLLGAGPEYHPNRSFRLPAKDVWGIRLIVVVCFVCVISSYLSDDIATFHHNPDAPWRRRAVFVILDCLEDTLYVAGPLWLSICYRTLSLQVWQLRDELVSFQQQQEGEEDNEQASASNDGASTAARLLVRHRIAYERVFEAAEHVSCFMLRPPMCSRFMCEL